MIVPRLKSGVRKEARNLNMGISTSMSVCIAQGTVDFDMRKLLVLLDEQGPVTKTGDMSPHRRTF